MRSVILTDVSHDLWAEQRVITPNDLGLPQTPAWSITKQALHGGRREGVDLIWVDNGALAFAVIPTRGMGLWKARYRELELGWKSPVSDGPVNPAFVNCTARGGLGWLQGFDELLARCGLESNGAPYVEGGTMHALHGRIANIPAHYVAAHIDECAPHTITIEGHVDETELFFTQIRMVTKYSTVPGSNRLEVHDEFTNLKDTPCTMQVLYHWNFGEPFLEAGSKLVAPFRTVCPRDQAAVYGLSRFDTYGRPNPGSVEQVFFLELNASKGDGRTVAILRNRAGNIGVGLRFAVAQLPCFSVWKNTGGLKEGYVTGLEPATNFPNPKPFEQKRGRVVTLQPHESFVAKMVFEVLDCSDEVARVEAEIRSLNTSDSPAIMATPVEPFVPEPQSLITPTNL